MPIKPKKNEAKQDFLKRCISQEIASGMKQDQAFSVCNLSWDEATGKKEKLKAINLKADVVNEKNENGTWLLADPGDKKGKRTFLINAYTGQLIKGFFRDIVIDLKGIRSKAKFPILREHERKSIVGHSLKAWADKGNYLIRSEYSNVTKDSQEVQDLIDEGFPFQASVGIKPVKVRRLIDEKESAKVNGEKLNGPLEIWTESQVLETSVCSLGADSDTATINLNKEQDEAFEVIVEQSINISGGTSMKLEEFQKDHPELFKDVKKLGIDSVNVVSLKKEAIDGEKERAVQILSVDNAPMEAKLQAIKEGLTVDQAYKLFWELQDTSRKEELKKLKEETPDPVEAEAKDKEEEDGKSADEKLDLAIRAFMKDHNLSYTEASNRVIRENPDLYDNARKKGK